MECEEFTDEECIEECGIKRLDCIYWGEWVE